MAVFLQHKITMKKTFIFVGALAVLLLGAQHLRAQKNDAIKPSEIKEKRTIYFTPEVYPPVAEIQEPTNLAFFSAVSNNISSAHTNKMIRADLPVEYDSIDGQTIQDYCKNNNADFAIVPKVKYFKVGLGKYVFSNQVVVSMKLFDAKGNLITESDYDTYKKNMRLLGSAENSVKIGTGGAMKKILKNLRKLRQSETSHF